MSVYKIDYRHPYTKGLKFLRAGSYRELVYDRDPHTIGSTGLVPTNKGLAVDYNSTNPDEYDDLAFSGATAVTVYALIYFDSLTTDGSDENRIIQRVVTDGTQGGVDFVLDVDPNKAYFGVLGQEAGNMEALSNTIIATGRWYMFTGRWQSGELVSIWLDGVDDTSALTTTPVSGAMSTGSREIWIGGRSDGADDVDGRIAFIAAYDNWHEDHQIYSLAKNPWQIFAPQRFYVPVYPYDATVIEAEAPAGPTLTITLVDEAGTTLPNLTGLSWAWFDESTVSTMTAPTAQGTGETTDGSGVLEIDITGTTLGATDTGILTLRDSTGYIYALYRVTLT